ncbi:MAG: formylglycine-generating enzyme family protein [Treponema sp.]|jgi:formylglycine-generating enzyme required for sulfatase activity|nr:formylglycine-generating enzyme family protein [Treponema sp.]
MKKKDVVSWVLLAALLVMGCPSPTGGKDPDTPSNLAEAKAMVWIPGGTFMMGSPASEPERDSDETQHSVTVSGFWMGKYEVTQGLYEEVMGSNPSYQDWYSGCGVGPNYPVYNVIWYDAVEFCNKLSKREGLTPYYTIDKTTSDPDNTNSYDTYKWLVTPNPSANGYRLPTEAQWEYACRGDYQDKATETATKPFGIGDGTKITGDMANFYGEYAYKLPDGEYEDPSGVYLGRTAVVGSYGTNNYGLYDMHGNVEEWCWDWYDDYPSGAQNDPSGPVSGGYRVIRDGSWGTLGRYLRSASRYYFISYLPVYKHDNIGFRLVRP